MLFDESPIERWRVAPVYWVVIFWEFGHGSYLFLVCYTFSPSRLAACLGFRTRLEPLELTPTRP
jgi:hypothetical protein